ncbi:MAG: restriction endonuclease subunit S, partial [Promethearchaeota archaeon]
KDGQIVNKKDIRYVSKELYEKWMPEKLEAGDILMTSEAPLGELFYLKERVDYCLSQRLFALRINKKILDSRFLYYYLQSPKGCYELTRRKSGTAAEGIKQSELRKVEVYFPNSLNEQKRIAEILSAFDEKIELNNKINQILEEMAQAIFKEWFVKFRFPGWRKVKFVDSELRKIPEGWEIIDLYEYIEFEGGSQPPKIMHIYEKREGYIRFIQNRDYESDTHITYIPESKRNKLCNEYDIMMDKYGEAGKVRFGLAGAYNVALAKITPKPPLMREYLRWFLKQPEIQQLIEGSAVASTRSSVNKLVFKNLKILLPPKRLMEKFEEIGRLYIENYLKIKAENQKLSALRDLLLPKLMSGKVIIK